MRDKNKRILSKERKSTGFNKESLPSGPREKKKSSNAPTYEDVRKKQLLEANEEEDKTIRRLEKLLKLDKRKSKSKKKLSSVFVNDGLDYLLEVVEGKNDEELVFNSSIGLDDDLDAVDLLPPKSVHKEKNKKNLEENVRKVTFGKGRTLSDLLKEKGELSDSDDKSEVCNIESALEYNEENKDSDAESPLDEDFVSENFELDSCNEENALDSANDCSFDNSELDENNFDSSDSKIPKDVKRKIVNKSQSHHSPAKKPKLWEDIYGRLRDASGNIVKDNSGVKKISSNVKDSKDVSEQKQEELLKIKRKLKGLLNRLSESNMQPISREIEEMYMKNSRNDMNETLFLLMSDLVLTSIITPPRLIMEQAMLIALLHANIGSEIGAYFLQHVVQKLDKLFKSSDSYGEGKECNNVLTFLSHLYNFRVTSSTLIFDVFHHLIESFKNKDIELIQLFLKSIGFVLRKDDPLKLKEIVLSIQSKAATVKKDQSDSRISFMLDTLTAIRNNNMYKIPDYDPSILDHSKKLLKGFIRKGNSIQELAISYEDLLKAEEKGRWWIVGSAWSNQEDTTSKNSSTQTKFLPKTHVSEKILELAQKQHMNTEIRKSIFCIIMTAEDYMDAFEKLLKLNLRNQQEREIISVILHCALQEKTYNPYYAYLAGKFCSFNRKYQMSLQFSLWDRFKELSKMKPRKISNLAQFLSHLFLSGALPLSVLKVIHFSEMDKTMVRFFRQILLAVLLHESEETCMQVFRRISAAKNLNLLREGLRLFMHHFVLRNTSKLEPEVAEKLSERVKLAENSLNAAKNAFRL